MSVGLTNNSSTAIATIPEDDYDQLRNGFRNSFKNNDYLPYLVFCYLTPRDPSNPSLRELHTLVVFRDFYGKRLPGTKPETEQLAKSMGLNAEQHAYILHMHVISQYRHDVNSTYQYIPYSYTDKERDVRYCPLYTAMGSWYIAGEGECRKCPNKKLAAMNFHDLRHAMLDFLSIDKALANAGASPDYLTKLLEIENLDINESLHRAYSAHSPLGCFLEETGKKSTFESIQLLVQDERFDFTRIESFAGETYNILGWAKAHVDYNRGFDKETNKAKLAVIKRAFVAYQAKLSQNLTSTLIKTNLLLRDLLPLIEHYLIKDTSTEPYYVLRRGRRLSPSLKAN